MEVTSIEEEKTQPTSKNFNLPYNPKSEYQTLYLN